MDSPRERAWFRLAAVLLSALGALLALLWVARPEREVIGAPHARGATELAPAMDAATPLEAPVEAPQRATPPPGTTTAQPVAQVPDVAPAWPGPCSIHGQITRTDGQGPTGARIRVRNERGQVSGAEVTVDDARFRITGLERGRHWLLAGGHGYHDTESDVWLPHGEAAQRLDVELRPRAMLDVTVHAPSGQPFLEAGGDARLWRGLLAVEFQEPPPERHAPTDGQRSAFDVHAVDPASPHLGRLSLREALPTHVALLLGHEVLATQWVGFDARGVDFVLDPERLGSAAAELRFRVLDASGRPADASAMLLTDRRMTSGKVLDDGTCHFAGLIPEEVTLVVNAEGHRFLERSLVLEPGSTALGDLQLEPASVSRGRLVFPDGVPPDVGPPASLAIRYERVRADGTREPNPSLRLGADADGSFLLGLDPGRYWLQAAFGDWMSRGVVVELPLGEAQEVHLALQRRAHLVLHLAAGDWVGLHYRVLDDSGFPSGQAGRFDQRAPLRLALPPGPHRLVLTDGDGRVSYERPFVLGEDELVLELAL